MENESSNNKSKSCWTTINKIVTIATLIGICFGIKEYFDHKQLAQMQLEIDKIDNRPIIIPEQELRISNVRLRHFSNGIDIYDKRFTIDNPPQNVVYKVADKYIYNGNKKAKKNNPRIEIYTEYTVDVHLEIKNIGKRKAIFQAFLIGDGPNPVDSIRLSFLDKEKRVKSVKEMGNPSFDLRSDITFHEMQPNDSFTVFVRNHTLRRDSFDKNRDILINSIFIYKDELDNYYDTFTKTIFNLDTYTVQVYPIYESTDSLNYKLIDIEFIPNIPPVHKIFKFVKYSYNTEYVYSDVEKQILKSFLIKK